jgi:leucyl-tRNA synthetase
MGFISFIEPFKKMINQGMILGRSSFVNGIKYSVKIEDKMESEIDSTILKIPQILISLNKLNSSEFRQRIIEELNKIIVRRLPVFENYEFGVDYKISIVGTSYNRHRININYVENDILNLELAFKDPIFKGLSAAEWIFENSGDFICGHEIDKMSKTYYNVQTPDELVEKFGADTLRCYEMFLGPLEQAKPWDTKGINGVHNFLRKFWRLFHDANNNFVLSNGVADKASLKTLHKTIKKIQDDLERYSFNTAVSNFMIATNELTEQKCNNREVLSQLLILLSPYAPHITEELWALLGNEKSITQTVFPNFDPAYLVEAEFAYPVSFNGKMRFTLPLPTELDKEAVEKAVLENEQTLKYLAGNTPKKVIVVQGKIVNIVI